MSIIRIKQGFNIPIAGELTSLEIEKTPVAIPDIGLLAQDALGIKPKMLVQQGDDVQIGSPLFFDKKDPEVLFTSPVSGKITKIDRF